MRRAARLPPPRCSGLAKRVRASRRVPPPSVGRRTSAQVQRPAFDRTTSERSTSLRKGPDRVADRQRLPLRMDAFRIADLRAEEPLQPVVAVEPATILTHLRQPRPDGRRGSLDSDGTRALESIQDLLVSREGGLTLVACGTPATRMVVIQHCRRRQLRPHASQGRRHQRILCCLVQVNPQGISKRATAVAAGVCRWEGAPSAFLVHAPAVRARRMAVALLHQVFESSPAHAAQNAIPPAGRPRHPVDPAADQTGTQVLLPAACLRHA
jgi:hypothetical protein